MEDTRTPTLGVVQVSLNYETDEVEKTYRCPKCFDGSSYDSMTDADGVQPCLYCKRPVQAVQPAEETQ